MDTTHLPHKDPLCLYARLQLPALQWNDELHNQRPVIAKWQPASLSLQGPLHSYPLLEPNHRTTPVAAVARLQHAQPHDVAIGLQQSPDVVFCYVQRHLAKEKLVSRTNTLLILDHGSKGARSVSG